MGGVLTGRLTLRIVSPVLVYSLGAAFNEENKPVLKRHLKALLLAGGRHGLKANKPP